jgi:hypothetical protein
MIREKKKKKKKKSGSNELGVNEVSFRARPYYNHTMCIAH